MSVQVKGSGTIGGLDEGLVVSGIVTSSTQVNVGSNIKLGNAGVITATSFVGSGAQLTGITQTTINSNTNNYLITGTGTANTLQGEANLTFDGTGNLIQSGSAAASILRVETTANDGDGLIQADGRDSSGNLRRIMMRSDAGADQYRIISSDTTYNLALCTGNAPRLLIAGNSAATSIGGSNVFNAMLTVQGDISGQLLHLRATENTSRLMISGNNTSGCELNLYDESGGQRGILGVSGTEFFIKAPNTNAPMSFYTHNGTSLAERMVLKSDGKVGMQVATPKSNLHVYGPGDIRIGSQYGGHASIAQQVEYSSGYTGVHWMFETNGQMSWSFDGVLIVHGSGGSSYGTEVTHIKLVLRCCLFNHWNPWVVSCRSNLIEATAGVSSLGKFPRRNTRCDLIGDYCVLLMLFSLILDQSLV